MHTRGHHAIRYVRSPRELDGVIDVRQLHAHRTAIATARRRNRNANPMAAGIQTPASIRVHSTSRAGHLRYRSNGHGKCRPINLEMRSSDYSSLIAGECLQPYTLPQQRKDILGFNGAPRRHVLKGSHHIMALRPL